MHQQLLQSDMGYVNVSDQLQESYRPDAKRSRKHKWWHAIYYWEKGTDLIYVYICVVQMIHGDKR